MQRAQFSANLSISGQKYDVSRNIYTTSSYKCVLEVGDSVKDKSDSVFGALPILDSSGCDWILGRGAIAFQCHLATPM